MIAANPAAARTEFFTFVCGAHFSGIERIDGVETSATQTQRIATPSRKGVISGHLELVAAMIPQLHPFRT